MLIPSATHRHVLFGFKRSSLHGTRATSPKFSLKIFFPLNAKIKYEYLSYPKFKKITF